MRPFSSARPNRAMAEDMDMDVDLPPNFDGQDDLEDYNNDEALSIDGGDDDSSSWGGATYAGGLGLVSYCRSQRNNNKRLVLLIGLSVLVILLTASGGAVSHQRAIQRQRNGENEGSSKSSKSESATKPAEDEDCSKEQDQVSYREE